MIHRSGQIGLPFLCRLAVLSFMSFGLGEVSIGYAQDQDGNAGGDTADKPNIVFVFIDDMGYGDLSCFGNRDIDTPNLDRLAEQGAKYEQFYVASPICSPSRVAVTTGQYPARHRIHSFLASRRRNRERGMRDFLDPNVQTIGKQFKSVGYETAHFGKWHMGGGRDVDDAPLPSEYGFDESLVSFEGLGDRILPPGNLSRLSEALERGEITHVEKHEQTKIYVDRSIDFIQRQAMADQPFYLQLWLNDVHDSHIPSNEQLAALESRFGNARTGTPAWADNPFQVAFYAVLIEMDRQLGRVFDTLDELEIADETLVIVTSDNGPTAWPRYHAAGQEAPGSTGGLRGRKWSLYEGGIREPLIVRWPSHVPAGHVDSTSVISTLDLLPTLSALVGASTSGLELDGVDISDAFLGTPIVRSKPLFFEYGRDPSFLQPASPVDQSPNLAVRQGSWKLLVDADLRRLELYDLSSSQLEFENVAGDHPEVVQELVEEVFRWKDSLPGYGHENSSTHLPIRQLISAELGHSVPSRSLPKVANSEIMVDVRLTTEGKNGVIVAHGGEGNGYALFLQNGLPHFTVRSNSIATTIASTQPLPNDEIVRIHASLDESQQLTLKVDGRDVAIPVAASFLTAQPLDPFDVGRDQAGRVGDYGGDFQFSGDLHRIMVTFHQVKQATRPSRLVSPTVAELQTRVPTHPHPVPIFQRRNWMSLHGYWNYEITSDEDAAPVEWKRRLRVPFPIESLLSDVQLDMEPDTLLWCRSSLSVPENWNGDQLMLHVENASGLTQLILNGSVVYDGKRGQFPMSIDITSQVNWKDPNELIARFEPTRVADPSDKSALNRFAIAKDPNVVTGFNDAIWLESRPKLHVSNLQLNADSVNGTVDVLAQIEALDRACELHVRLEHDGKIVGQQVRALEPVERDGNGSDEARYEFAIDSPRLWAPDSPELYDVVCELRVANEIVDHVTSYCAFRALTKSIDEEGATRFELNGQPFFVIAAEYAVSWPGGLTTAPTDRAIQLEMERAKSLGINTLILSEDMESARWYHWADRYGVLVWQSIAASDQEYGWLSPRDPQPQFANPVEPNAKQQQAGKLSKNLARLARHPSIVAWLSDSSSASGSPIHEEMVDWIEALGTGLVIRGADMSILPVNELSDIDAGVLSLQGLDSETGYRVAVFDLGSHVVPGHSAIAHEHDWTQVQTDRDEAIQTLVEKASWLGELQSAGVAGAFLGPLVDSPYSHNGIVTLDRGYVKPQPGRLREMLRQLNGQGDANVER